MLITSYEEYLKVMKEIESLFDKGFSKLSQEEDDRLEDLSNAAEKWEIAHYNFD